MDVMDYLFICWTPDGRVSGVMVDKAAPMEVYSFLESEPALREYLSVPARAKLAEIRAARAIELRAEAKRLEAMK